MNDDELPSELHTQVAPYNNNNTETIQNEKT